MKNKINSLQLGSIVIMMNLAAFMGIVFYTLLHIASVDSYISIILAGIIGIPLLLIILYIANYEPDLSLNKKLEKLYGKVLGNIINIIIIIMAVTMGISLMYNTTNFIVSQFLSDTPLIIIGITLSLIVIYTNIKGLETLTRTSLILFVLTCILIVITLIGLLPKFELNNLLPFLEFGLEKPFIGACDMVILNFITIALILVIPKNQIVDKKNYNKAITIFYIMSVIFLFIVVSVTIGNLGIHLASIYQYPEYMVLKHIELFNFLDRIENIATSQWIFASFICLCFIVFFISNSIKYNNSSKVLPTVITFSILFLALKLFNNNTAFNNYIYHTVPKLRILLCSILILITITIFIKKKFSKNK